MKVFSKHISGNSLYLVLFISFIIAVLLLLLISNTYYIQVETLRYRAIKEMIDLNNSAIYKQLGKMNELENNSWQETTIFEQQLAKTESFSFQWGAFAILGVKSTWKNIEYKKIGISGQNLFTEGKIGLFMSDKGKYLSIAGNTKLTGDCYLPALGIRSVYIDGKAYSGKKLIYGTEKRSTDKLPQINIRLLQNAEDLLEGNFDDFDSLGNPSDLNTKENIERSFESTALVYNTKGPVVLDNLTLIGKIIIRSDSLILLGKNLKPSNILIVAPMIIVEKGFRGNLQLIARDSLLIDKDAELTYPSSVVVYNYAGTKAYCYIQENSIVSGGIICTDKAEPEGNSELILSTGSVINGVVYSKGSTTLSGSIYGSLYTNKFLLKTPRGYYENHLLDAVIDPESQMQNMVVPIFFESTNYKREVVEWVK